MDLREFEVRLNEDDEFREAFLRDPVQSFRDEGISLPLAAEEALRSLVSSLRTPETLPSGSSLRAEQDREVNISINISKSF